MADNETTDDLLSDWNLRLSAALGVPPAEIDQILALAGVVAHAVVRPAAPLTAFLVGYATAMNSRDDAAAALGDAIAVARGLASSDAGS